MRGFPGRVSAPAGCIAEREVTGVATATFEVDEVCGINDAMARNASAGITRPLTWAAPRSTSGIISDDARTRPHAAFCAITFLTEKTRSPIQTAIASSIDRKAASRRRFEIIRPPFYSARNCLYRLIAFAPP